MENQSPEFHALEQEAISQNTSVARLEELVHLNKKLAVLVASNPATPPELLQKLSNGSYHFNFFVDKNIAANPNTPTKILMKIGDRYRVFSECINIFDKNIEVLLKEYNQLVIDKLDIVSGENLSIIIERWNLNCSELIDKWNNCDLIDTDEINLEDYQKIIKSRRVIKRDITSKITSKIFNYEGAIIYHYLSINPFSPIYIFKNLIIQNSNLEKEGLDIVNELISLSKNFAVWVASHPNIPPELLTILANKYGRIKNVVDNPNMPIEALLKKGYFDMLFKHTDWHLISENNPLNFKIRIETLIYLLEYDTQLIKENIANNTTGFITDNWLNILAKHRSYRIRYHVAQHPNTSVKILEQLANDSNPSIRTLVIEKEKFPVGLLEKFADDPELSIRIKIAQHNQASINLLDKLSFDDSPLVRCAVAWKHNTPVNILEKLSRDSDFKVRGTVASNRNVPVFLLEKLALDYKKYVCCKVAENPNTPIHILSKLATNPENFISIATNPNTPGHILQHLADYTRNDWVLLKVASHANTSIPLLEKLIIKATKIDDKVKQELFLAVGSNPNTPTYILEKILTNQITYKVIEAIISHPNITINIIEMLSTQDDLEQLKIIASSNNTPAFILKNISETDGKNYQDWRVLKKIAKNPNTPIEVLQKLVKDSRKTIREDAVFSYNQRLIREQRDFGVQ